MRRPTDECLAAWLADAERRGYAMAVEDLTLLLSGEDDESVLARVLDYYTPSEPD